MNGIAWKTSRECSLEAIRQAEATNAEKIEDNLYTLINYANELELSDLVRNTLNNMLAHIKRRTSFDLSLSVFGGNGTVRLSYIESEDGIVDAYTDQRRRDAYKLATVNQYKEKGDQTTLHPKLCSSKHW